MRTTHQSFSISFVCGAPGSGKSYVMTRDVIERLIESENRIFTNLPLDVDAIAEYVAKERKCTAEEVASRIEILPPELLKSWRDHQSGPWSLMDRASGSDLILDECHVFCKKGDKSHWNKLWEDWLGEVRHEGWSRLVFITQDESKVGKPITAHAEMRFELTNNERERIPIVHIPMHYLYELRASFTREYRATIVVSEYRRIKGKLVSQHRERYQLEPFWFQFYHSYSGPGGGAKSGEGAKPIVREFEKRPVFLPKRMVIETADGPKRYLTAPVWFWVFRLHWVRLSTVASVAVFGTWMLLGGGLQWSLNYFVRDLSTRMRGRTAVAKSDRPVAGAGVEPGNTDESNRRRADQVDLRKRQSGGALPLPVSKVELGRIVESIPEPDRELVLRKLGNDADLIRLQAVELEQVEADRKAAAEKVFVTAISDKWVWFSIGGPYRAGEEILEAPLAGRRVASVNGRRRRVVLSDGGIVGFGGGSGGVSTPEAVDEPRRVSRPANRAIQKPVRKLDSGESGGGSSVGSTNAGESER